MTIINDIKYSVCDLIYCKFVRDPRNGIWMVKCNWRQLSFLETICLSNLWIPLFCLSLHWRLWKTLFYRIPFFLILSGFSLHHILVSQLRAKYSV